MNKKQVLAVDLGASGGRVMLGAYDGNAVSITELHRFSNDPVFLNGTMYWDFLRLFYEIKQGITKSKAYGLIDSLGVDTWGVDFGLLDKDGRLIENPIHYRDKRTQGIMDQALQKIRKDEFYQITGSQFMEINTVFQLYSLVENRPELLTQADSLLLMPDLFHYFLSGVKCSECSIASTTQMMDSRQGTWSPYIIEKLGIPQRLLQEIIPCATKLGKLLPEISEELGVEPMEIITVAGHDTQSALAAVPAEGDFIFISCGTWSLVGTELSSPSIGSNSFEANLTNEMGCEGKTSFLKNIIGTWLIQESRRQWIREGKEYSFSHLDQMASKAKPFQCLIDPDDPEFVSAGDIPKRIRRYAESTSQKAPDTEAAVVRCIHESLALKYRKSVEDIKQCTGLDYPVIYLIGGGAQSTLLCQMTANACSCPVISGLPEATVIGNMGIQLIAMGDVKDLNEFRKIVARSFDFQVFQPKDTKQWNERYYWYTKHILEKMEIVS